MPPLRGEDFLPRALPSSLHTSRGLPRWLMQQVLGIEGVVSIDDDLITIDATPWYTSTSGVVCNDEGVALGWTMPPLRGEEKAAPSKDTTAPKAIHPIANRSNSWQQGRRVPGFIPAG